MTKTRTQVLFDRDTGCFRGLSDEILAKLRTAYPGVNLRAEIAKMEIWLLSTKGSKRQGTVAFIMGWLGRAARSVLDLDSVDDVYDSHLERLWQRTSTPPYMSCPDSTATQSTLE